MMCGPAWFWDRVTDLEWLLLVYIELIIDDCEEATITLGWI